MTECEIAGTDDNEGMESHIKELKKEVKKNKRDKDKIVRLLSLSYVRRRDELMAESAVVRVSSTLLHYPCFKNPFHVSKSYILLIFNISIHLRTTLCSSFKKCSIQLEHDLLPLLKFYKRYVFWKNAGIRMLHLL